MSRRYTIGELKSRLPEAIAAVQEGESVVVTYGRTKRAVAVLAPISAKKSSRRPGEWKGLLTYSDPEEALKPLPRSHSGEAPSNTDPLQQ